MTYQRTLIFVWVLSVLGAVNIVAQTTHPLTLDESLRLALENNPGIKIAENEMAWARAGARGSYSAILPQLELYANYQHLWNIQTSRIPNFLKPMLGPVGPLVPGMDQMPDFVDIAFGLENTLRYGATFSQPLFLGGAGTAGITVAGAASRMSEHQLSAGRQALILETASAFYACLLAQRVVEVQEGALEQAQANQQVVARKYDVGMASPLDKMRTEVEVTQLQTQLISGRNNERNTRTRLRTVLALDQSLLPVVVGTLDYVEDSCVQQPLGELLQQALAHRPEIRGVAEEQLMSEGNLDLARSEFLPKLVFLTDYSYLAMKNDVRFSGDDFSKGFSSSLMLQFPVFNGLKSRADYEKASLEITMAQHHEEQIRDAVAAEVEFAHNKLRETNEKVLSTRRAVELSTEAYRLARVMYDEGANTQLDVLTARVNLTQAQDNLANVLFEYHVARYQIRKATGTLEGVLS